MSYYDNQQWPAPGSQGGWDQQTPPARSGTKQIKQATAEELANTLLRRQLGGPS
jgi:hypothetical protein